MDLAKTPIKVSTIHPGFIRSEINERIEKAPFLVDTVTGCKAIVKAIEKEGGNSYVPSWPWAIIQLIMRVAPMSMLAKMS